MTNEEIYIINRFGQRNPFLVPEGYFDQLTDKVMDRLPKEETKPALIRSIRPWLYAAACLLVVILTTTIYFNSSDSQQQLLSSAMESSVSSDNYVEEAADYAMLDNHDIYACLLNE